ncbi:MAG: RagB/SusD family nutrient uptake outer membrane protein [Bacteroides sp.]|uniref:RagB/SusD family nutrient uptake outer membrane protein n=1 Tax=Bacteroides sp. TaxID=29523 RepID=UPI002FCA2F2B
MKRLSLYIIAASSLMLHSCTGDWLNLNPSTSVTSEQAVSTLNDAQTALNGIYRLAASHSYYGDNYLYYADCRGEDVQARISKGAGRRVSPYYEFNVTADDAFNVTRVWNQPYIVIHQANSLIEKIDAGKVITDNTTELNRIKAEALSMRGLALFHLTQLFGMPYTLNNGSSLGVAIETTTTPPTHQPTRNTVAECYAQVIKDMEQALPHLSNSKHDGYQNIWSVKALLSRIYLNMNNNAQALKYAKEVINNGGIYTLFTHDEYPRVWGKDFNSESLFEFYYTLSEPAGGSGGEGAPMVYADNTKDWNNLVLTKAFLDLLNEDPKDVRHTLTRLPEKPTEDVEPIQSAGHPKYLIKYPGKTGDVTTGNPQDNDICVIRLSEVYLNAAEAAFKLGNSEEALTYLNAIVTRSNPEKSVAASQLTLERILQERRRELVGEGQAFFDYLRNGKSVSRIGGWHLPTLSVQAATITPSDPRVVLPIPQAEIDANPNMIQNP